MTSTYRCAPFGGSCSSQMVLSQLHSAGNDISNDAIAHLSPARFAQINPFGVYNFDTTDIPARHPLKDVQPD
jgi:hypothetical protein